MEPGRLLGLIRLLPLEIFVNLLEPQRVPLKISSYISSKSVASSLHYTIHHRVLKLEDSQQAEQLGLLISDSEQSKSGAK